MSPAEKETLRTCLRLLGSLEDSKAAFEPEWDVDGSCGRIAMKTSWGDLSFRTFLHLRIAPKTAALIIRQIEESKTSGSPLLLTDFLSENLAARLRNRKINCMDSCGNAYLHCPPLHIEISGRPRKNETVSAARPFQQAGLKLIFVILTNPEAASWTCRRLAAEAGIALGAVSLVLQRLEKTGYLERQARRMRVLISPEALLRRWELGFSENLREKLMLHTCRLSGGLGIIDLPNLLREKGLGESVLTGGELGAHLLLDHPEPHSAVLHLPGDTLKTMLRLHLVPDPEGDVQLMQIFSPANTWQGWHPEGMMLADPLLIHAEMAHQGILSTSMEKKFMNDFLLPRFKPEAGNREGTG